MRLEEDLCWAQWSMPVRLLLSPTEIPFHNSEYLPATVVTQRHIFADQHCNRRAYADSKTLTEDKRESLFAVIKQDPQISFLFDVLSAADISMGMLSRQV